ncbi:MAG: PTS glucose transporter subunit IIA [Spirochaetaceae bacterium]|jgi:PTS system beta-glucosides-specific IIC component|nr:PTS glucose transporter subunit IIA [Spirochaetaceae bacterium]
MASFGDFLAGIFKTGAHSNVLTIVSPLNGKIVPLDKVKDEAFSSGTLGKGVAIIPDDGHLVSPLNGKVDMVIDSKHAIALISDNGIEILVHIGMDTVTLKGSGFTPAVAEGDVVKIGTPLIDFDIPAIQAAGFSLETPLVIVNSDAFTEITATKAEHVKQGDILLTLKK